MAIDKNFFYENFIALNKANLALEKLYDIFDGGGTDFVAELISKYGECLLDITSDCRGSDISDDTYEKFWNSISNKDISKCSICKLYEEILSQ